MKEIVNLSTTLKTQPFVQSSMNKHEKIQQTKHEKS